MLAILSPAKTLDFDTAGPESLHSMPEFGAEARKLAKELQGYTPSELSSLLDISSKLAYLNHERYQEWTLAKKVPKAKQAVLAYKGDVYNGMKAEDFSKADLEWAQHHLRILSGLYGILRPMDLIMPYRLEFATKLKIEQYNSLYEYWSDPLDRSLASLIQTEESGILIDLASKEYAKALDLDRDDLKIITPVFKEYRNGEYRFLSMFGKKARGMMARYIIQNRITDPEQLKLFDEEGYSFNDPLSSEGEWVFTR